jgi:uncharacterized membrane protein YqjE
MGNSTTVENHTLQADGSPTRSTGALLQEIVSHVEEIIRSEVRLAKVELKQEAVKAGKAAGMLGAGGLIGFCALALIIGTCTAALAIAIPVWAALLCMGVLCGIVAAGLLSAGRARLKRVRTVPERTAQTLKDDVAWLKSRT